MAERQLPKLKTRVRFPSPAPAANRRAQTAHCVSCAVLLFTHIRIVFTNVEICKKAESLVVSFLLWQAYHIEKSRADKRIREMKMRENIV